MKKQKSNGMELKNPLDENYCDCGNELISDEERRNKVCEECK